MIEAKITCICAPGIQVPDLGLDLKKGDVVYLPEAEAKASKDLSLARRSRGVVVQMVERCRERRRASQERGFRAKAPPSIIRPAPPHPESKPEPKPDVDLEGMFKRLLDPLLVELAALRRAAQKPVVVPGAARASVPTHESLGTVIPDTPMFIPNDLGSSGLKAEIDSVTETSSGGDFDQASAALKALKKKKKP
jgi:hypothetical protein